MQKDENIQHLVSRDNIIWTFKHLDQRKSSTIERILQLHFHKFIYDLFHTFFGAIKNVCLDMAKKWCWRTVHYERCTLTTCTIHFPFETEFLQFQFSDLFFFGSFLIRLRLHHIKTKKKTNEWTFYEVWTLLHHCLLPTTEITKLNMRKKNEREREEFTSFQLLFSCSVENLKLILGSPVLVDWHLTVWNYYPNFSKSEKFFFIFYLKLCSLYFHIFNI